VKLASVGCVSNSVTHHRINLS